MKKIYLQIRYAAILISLFIITITFESNNKCFGQQQAQTTLYTLNPILINPAYAGLKGYSNATLNARFQWVGIKGAPMTQFFSIHGQVKDKNLGMGLVIENDITGARLMQGVYAQMAYSFRLNKRYHRLSIGLNAGLDILQTNFADLQTNENDQADPLRANQSIISPNAGVGLYYYANKFYAGFSIPRLLSRTNGLALGSQSMHSQIFDPLFYLSGGYVFTLHRNWTLKTSALLKLQSDVPVVFDIGVSVIWMDKFYTGISYRYHESVIFTTMYRFHKRMYAGYSFDIPINGLALNQWGTHEISLSYQWGRELNKRKTSSCFYY